MSEQYLHNDPKTPRIPQTGFDIPEGTMTGFNGTSEGNTSVAGSIDELTSRDTNVSEFGASVPDITMNTEVGADETEDVKVVTPLSVSIPTFENVATLPTPMVYSPMSPAVLNKSPQAIKSTEMKINIPKRRAQYKPNLDGLIGSKPIRIISEVVPTPDTAQQRIISLPTVSEETTTENDKFPIHHDGTALADDSNSQEDDMVLLGYRIGEYTKALQWRKVKTIGVGNFSDVLLYESIDQNDPELLQVAVKRIRYPQELKDIRNRSANFDELLGRLDNSLTREISVLNSLNHPCIVKLFGVNDPLFIESCRPLYDMLKLRQKLVPCNLIMSYCVGGDLLAAMSQCSGNLDRWLIQRLFTEILLGVKYLHEHNIIHRDLKLENILLKVPLGNIRSLKDKDIYYEHSFVEIADFGLCKKIEPDELCTARCGSEDYVSPEILMGVPYDGHLSDTWAMGVILYSLLEDRLPFDPLPGASIRQKNRPTAHRIARFEWKWHKMIEDDSSAKEIVNNTLTRKNQRWNCNDIFNSAFIQEIVGSLQF